MNLRRLWIVAVMVCATFAVATAASASLRAQGRSLIMAVAAVADDSTPPTTEPNSSVTQSTPPSPEAIETLAGEVADDQAEAQGTHGAAVSTVAKDKQAVGTKTTGNGKTVTNHGMAVSVAARDGTHKAVKTSKDQSGGKSQANGSH
jgi:hypothetical protein